MRPESTCLLALALATLTACGGAAAPTDRMASAAAAVRAAREVGAPEEPRAALHLKLAEEQIDKSKRYIEDGQNMQADLALQRAQADAELALAIAREAKTVSEAQAAKADVQRLRSETGSSTKKRK